MTDTHEVVGKEHRRSKLNEDDTVFEVGDTITPTDTELAGFSDRFRELDSDGETESISVDEETESVSVDIDVSELTVDELRSELQESSFTAAELDVLEAAERDGESRDTALDAIDAQRG